MLLPERQINTHHSGPGDTKKNRNAQKRLGMQQKKLGMQQKTIRNATKKIGLQQKKR